MTVETFGKILIGEQFRDAVHVAVAPVIAAEILAPGRHIGFIGGDDSRLVSTLGKPLLGIVDPYLQCPVFKDEQFWMFLYPNTVTGLRHQWSHPNFDKEPLISSTNRADMMKESLSKKEAQEYLLNFAFKWNMDYPDMIDAAQSGWGLTANGIDIHSWSEIDDGGEKFWKSLEVVTGQEFDQEHKEKTYFSCSC